MSTCPLRCVAPLLFLLACSEPAGSASLAFAGHGPGQAPGPSTEAGGAEGLSGASGGEGGAAGADSGAAAGAGAPLAGAPTAGDDDVGGANAGGEACELTYSEGHGDLFVGFDDGLQLSIRSTFGASPPERLAETSRVCILVPSASRDLAEAMGGAPDSDQYAFLGVSGGAPFWLLPATPREGMPWLGASTETVPSAYYDDNQVQVRIAALELPEGGQLAAWSTSTFGVPSVMFSTKADVLTHSLPVGAHLHFSWGFSVAGTYTVTFSVEGARDGAWEHGPAAPLRFVVKP